MQTILHSVSHWPNVAQKLQCEKGTYPELEHLGQMGTRVTKGKTRMDRRNRAETMTSSKGVSGPIEGEGRKN